MSRVSRESRLAFAVVVGTALVSLVGLSWFACRGAHSRFLIPDSSAEWILYPAPPQIAIVADRVERHAVFQHSFEVTEVPERARLRVRAFGRCAIDLNETPIPMPLAESCTDLMAADVAANIRKGTNKIRAAVSNDLGPPALWLCLEGRGWSIASDENWTVSLDGALTTAAHRASEPMPLRRGNLAEGGMHPVESLRVSMPTLMVFASLSAGLLLLGCLVARRQAAFQLLHFRLSSLAVGLIAAVVLWVILFAHNTLDTPVFLAGFDAAQHAQYIQYIQEHRTLPLADQGWEMHHPPLYYMLATAALALFRLSIKDPHALLVMRLLGLAMGVGELVLVTGCMRLLFPGQPRRQLAGLALAAFLPVPIYICHNVSNEPLLMLLGTAAVYACLRVLRDDSPGPARYAVLGMCLGAALLTKITAVVLVGVVFLVLGGRLIVRREWHLRSWVRCVGVTLVTMLLVSGWHFARVWAHFGKPLVANFDAASGFHFWQDPGCATVGYLARFGRSLVDPFFSGLYDLPDGLYSTLWGDGLCSGLAIWIYRPPWNYDLMAAGFLLALIPSLAIVIGLIAALVQLVRQPRAEWFLLLGIAAGLAVATLYQFLRYPYYGHAKAFYWLTSLVTLCALGAWGLDLIARLGRVPQALLVVLLGTWAFTAYSAFWIQPNSAATLNYNGLRQQVLNRLREAEASFRAAIKADPHLIVARLMLAAILSSQSDWNKARQLIEQTVADSPQDPNALFALAVANQKDGRTKEAIACLRRATDLAPDHLRGYSILGSILLAEHEDEEAIVAFRQALRISPSSPSDHANLALLLARTGNVDEALAQYRHALALRPNHPEFLADLAWILATQEDARFRDADDALRLAMEACQRTDYQDATSLQSLAAAQAAHKRFQDAATTAKRALEAAASSGQASRQAQIQELVERYEHGKPYYARAPIRAQSYGALMPHGIEK